MVTNIAQEIMDGAKTTVCKLKSNPIRFTSIGYPTDETQSFNGLKKCLLMIIQWKQLLWIRR